jgi:hypothetical protein
VEMPEYQYKNFKIFYNVELDKTNKKLYRADGYAVCALDRADPNLSTKFHTEYTTEIGARNEIKKLIENYVDFEWQKFYEVHGNANNSRRLLKNP